MFFPAPSFASLSLFSFPRLPLWPLTHWNNIVAVLFFRRYVAFLKNLSFLIPIQPQSSHLGRFSVILLITYFESVWIFMGQLGGTVLAAITIAAIFSIWFDWSFLGILTALFQA